MVIFNHRLMGLRRGVWAT